MNKPPEVPCERGTFSNGPDVTFHPSALQTEIYRRMTPAERFNQAMALYWAARRLKAAGIRMLHPDWREARVETEVKRIFLHAVT